jgi:hypothetical protein
MAFPIPREPAIYSGSGHRGALGDPVDAAAEGLS